MLEKLVFSPLFFLPGVNKGWKKSVLISNN